MWQLSRALWLEAFRRFGTHMVDEVTLGGKVVFTKSISEQATEKAKQEGVDLSAEASMAYSGLGGGASGSIGYKESTPQPPLIPCTDPVHCSHALISCTAPMH